MSKIQIRKAMSNEARDVIEINTIVWAETYKNLVLQETINNKINKKEKRIIEWTKTIENDKNVIVALVDDKIVGFSSYGHAKGFDDEYGETYAMYILPEYQRMGIGKMMNLKCIYELLRSGYTKMVTRCLVGNPNNRFHESIGGVLFRVDDINLQGYPIKENVYIHDDLKASYENCKNSCQLYIDDKNCITKNH